MYIFERNQKNIIKIIKMKEKVKIESVNKISQIYSVDVHCNPLICDVKLDVDKTVSGQSEPMTDVASAKSNAYSKAKAEYKVDLIVDPTYIIRTTFSNLFFELLAKITLGFAKFGVRYVVTISGYAGYYTNPRSYYDHQKMQLEDLSEAINLAGDTDARALRVLKTVLQPEHTSSASSITQGSSLFSKGKGLLSKIPVIGKFF